MSNPPRNIDVVINSLMMTTKKHGMNTLEVIWEFRDLQSSMRYMAPECLVENVHWKKLLEILTRLFPITEKNKNDPFIKDLQSIFSGESTEEFEKYRETDEERIALHEYGNTKIVLAMAGLK